MNIQSAIIKLRTGSPPLWGEAWALLLLITGLFAGQPSVRAADVQLPRLSDADYSDGVSSPSGISRPSARVISNIVHAQAETIPNTVGATGFVWQWGQFIDHDLDLTQTAKPKEPFNIEVPVGDEHFDHFHQGNKTISFDRSKYDTQTGTGIHNPRQQVNQITSLIDASNVYGVDYERQQALRANDGTGQLKTSFGNLMPYNEEGLPNADGPDGRFAGRPLFLAGDIRANEQIALTAMHTLFVREHNRLASHIGAKNPELSGDEIYAKARTYVAAELQVITYEEYLPVLLGPNALNPYHGYNPYVNPEVYNEFSTVAYRFGHSALPPTLRRLDASGAPIPQGNIALRDAYFAPHLIIHEGGIEPLLRGLAAEQMENVDVFIIDEVRNFLFGKPGDGGLDLAALNIQRGRDHGMPAYNELRAAVNLPKMASFADITADVEVQQRLEEAYGHVDYIDAWVGGLAEDHVPGGLVGELFFVIIKDQYERLRDADKNWYQIRFSGNKLRKLEQTTLAKIIRRNTPIAGEIQDNVFLEH
jgi:peroxidase